MKLKTAAAGACLLASVLAENITVANPELLTRLSRQERTLLEKNYFFVAPSRFDQFSELYQDAKRTGIPILVTPDCILHSFHVLFDYALRTAEQEYFYKDLRALTEGLLEYEARALKKPVTKNVKAALINNVAFLAVGARLLDPAFKPPALVKNLVAKELAKIEAAAGFDSSAIFKYQEDYSQYVPRGHYTRHEIFERYFKAMMWFGRIGFYLQPGNRSEDIELGRSLTRQAILLCAAVKNGTVNDEPALAVWERIYQPTVFFVGTTDDLTIHDYLPLADSVFGPNDIYSALEADDKLDDFIRQAMSLPPPRIVSMFVADTLDPGQATKGLRFMGQRFIPDSYVFQELVYDKVGTRANPRLLPKGLDVMAALGSNRAFEILDRVYNETQFVNYREQMAKLRKEFSSLGEKDWQQNLYGGWLYALKLLNQPPAGALPRFMMSPVWPDKCLMSSLGSWAELRHDTILYAKQSYTVGVTALPPRPKALAGYVEPYPKVYAAIADITDRMLETLGAGTFLHREVQAKLESLKTVCRTLAAISTKELAGEPLSDDELGLIHNIGTTLENLATFSREFGATFLSETDETVAVIADVHTDPFTGQMLEVGVGNPFSIFALVPFEGTLSLARGGVFSYYEFTRDASERLTDEAWQELEPKPDLPVWTQYFIVK